MKTSTHRYILPPVLLLIHFTLLLPLVASRPDLRALFSPPTDKLRHPASALYIEWAIIFGLGGFAIAYLLKQIVGRIPLPSAQRRKKLAEWLERIMLFGMGALEEVWRYGVVHILVVLEMKQDIRLGFRTGWETVYVMGWVWSLAECSVSWWNCRPDTSARNGPTSTHNTPARPRPRTRRTKSSVSAQLLPGGDASPPQRRRESLKVLRRGSVLAVQGDDNPFLAGLPGRVAWNESSDANRSAVSLLSGGGLDKRAEDESDGNEASRLTRGFIFPSAAPDSPVSRPFSSILEARSSPKPSFVRPDASDAESGLTTSALEDSDFGDDEQDAHSITSEPFSISSSRRTSSETSRSHDVDGAGTPLLSSSIPYDPSHHPHHESSSLLRNQHRRMSYNAIANHLPVLHSDDGEEDSHVVVRDYDIENQPLESHPCVNNVVQDDDDIFRTAARERREYPSYPSYSSGYNHSHFSLHNSAGTEGSPSSHAVKANPGPQRPHARANTRTTQRLLYGVSVNSMSPFLPIIWRTSALLRHLASALFFAFPLIYSDDVNAWTLVGIVGIIAMLKGLYTVTWLGGNVARHGAKMVTGITAAISIAAYIGSLALWRIII